MATCSAVLSSSRRNCLLLCVVHLILGFTTSSNHFYEKDLTVYTFQNRSIDYYRYLYLDNETDSLLVGAKNHILKLNLSEISRYPDVAEVKLNENYKKVCTFQGNSDEYCQNYIKFIVREDNSTIFLCGTDANTPTQYRLQDIKTNPLKAALGVGKKDTVCPKNPFDNTTAVYVTEGNPGDLPALYSATKLESNKATISRPALSNERVSVSDKLENADPRNWLNEPQFVASFDIDDHVYFFFREVAVEFTNCQKKTVSRVAKVCKKDLGGSSLLVNKWTTFQKATLNCSIDGEFPFYFDEIQDVYLSQETKTFYGVFISSTNGVSGSAICAFSEEDINRTMSGDYKYQKTDDSYWLPVPQSKYDALPDGSGRPGECKPDSKKLPDLVESFMMQYPLMDKAVHHMYGEPLFYKEGVQMQVLQMDESRSTNSSFIFFASTNNGDVYKVYSWINMVKMKPEFVIASQFSLSKSEVIWDMKLKDGHVYVGTDSAVKQFPVDVCSKYDKIDQCANDPYCCWQKGQTNYVGECKSIKNSEGNSQKCFIQKDLKGLLEVYDNSNKRGIIPVSEGVSHVVKHGYPFALTEGSVKWLKKSGLHFEALSVNSSHITDKDQNFVILKTRKEDSGEYKAMMGDKTLAHQVIEIIVSKGDFEKIWEEKFTDWCVFYEDIKKIYKGVQSGR